MGAAHIHYFVECFLNDVENGGFEVVFQAARTLL